MALEEWIAARIRHPVFAGAVVAALALPFSSWYLLWSDAAEFLVGIPPALLTVLVVLNAFLVTTAVWSRAVADAEAMTRRRLGAAGLAVGLLSHLTLGLIVSGAYVLWDENGLLVEGLPSLARLPELLGVWLLMGAFVGLYSVVFTLGVPVLLSVGVGVGFARIHRRVRGE